MDSQVTEAKVNVELEVWREVKSVAVKQGKSVADFAGQLLKSAIEQYKENDKT